MTERQREVLAFIGAQDAPPTVREIAAHFSLSLGAVAKHLKALRDKGYLKPGKRQARGLRVSESYREHQQRLVHVPLYGSIPAGFADERHQEAEGCVTVDEGTLGGRRTQRLFAVRVWGDSMTGKHILAGDIAVLEHGREARTGDVVAALIDGESTLKLYNHNRGRPFLRAANPKYPDQHPSGELRVQGVMVAIIRRAPPR